MTYGTVKFNQEPTKSFINFYKFIDLGECQASYEIWGDLTPDIPTKASKCFTFSCGNILLLIKIPQLFVFHTLILQ